MHSIAVSCGLLVLLSLKCTGEPVLRGPLVEHESTLTLPSLWEFHSEAADNESLHLRVALRQPNEDYMRIAEEVSDPDHPRYGHYLSRSQLEEAMPDLDPTARLVEDWLIPHAASGVSRSGEWIDFDTTVSQARTLLDATFAKYTYNGRDPVLRTMSYSVPAALSNKIDFVYPASHFLNRFSPLASPSLTESQKIATNTSKCDGNTCPKTLTKKYDINYMPPNNLSKSKIGIGGFLGQYPDTEDVHSFLKNYGLSKPVPRHNYNVKLINGGKNPNPQNPGLEAMIDLEYSTVFLGPLHVTFYSVGGRPPSLKQPGNKHVPKKETQNEPYLQFLESLLAEKSPPQVISISYSDTENTVPRAYARRVCNLFGRLAARGVSVIGSSGDGGAQGTGFSNCKGPKGHTRFLPTFPSSCPWVTSVGATAPYGGAASFSSGGFSNYFPRPKWQATAVQHYIKLMKGAHHGLYNKTGRGIPDVSAIGENYLVVAGGSVGYAEGTSCSTPVFASMIVLINDLRLRAGKPVLGFLNPLLYSHKIKSTFKDVTKGQNVGCSSSKTSHPGYKALVGWDAVTGLGEPNFKALRKILT